MLPTVVSPERTLCLLLVLSRDNCFNPDMSRVLGESRRPHPARIEVRFRVGSNRTRIAALTLGVSLVR